MKIVVKFRKIKLGNKVMDCLYEHSKEEKVSREKNNYRDQIWGKVNGWLTEIDKGGVKSTESTDEKDLEPLAFDTVEQLKGQIHAKMHNMEATQELYSIYSKDMFDAGFEMTKDDVLSRDFMSRRNYDTTDQNKKLNYGTEQESRKLDTLSNYGTLNTVDFDN